MKKIKHSKYKNTGFLFEILVRQLTSEALRGLEPVAQKILTKHFCDGSELLKEYNLYNVLLSRKVSTVAKGKQVLDVVLESRRKLNDNKLRKEKYALIRDISKVYDVKNFFKSQVDNYKTIASVYKLFENATSDEIYDPENVLSIKKTILESVCSKPIESKKNYTEDEVVLEMYKAQDKDIRLFTLRQLIRNFNNKYRDLNERQKMLIKEYINNISNTNNLREYLDSQVSYIQRKLLSFNITDPVMKIKIREVVKQLNTAKKGGFVKESQITSALIAFDLIDEVEKNLKLGVS